MNFTPIARTLLRNIDRRATTAALDPETAQRSVLASLIKHGAATEWGRSHRYDKIASYADYAEAVKVGDYETFRTYVMRMVAGEKSVLWPGITRRYAQSSGTSGGKSKYIPLTDRSLQKCHYAGSTCVVARYLSCYPDSRLFSGRAFILGGSYANELNLNSDVKVGDLSATLIDKITPMAALFRVPSKQTALMEHWHEKLPKLVEETLHANVTNLSGVPSWFMTVIREVMHRAGATELHQVWPNLEVFFHGGISFAPYREEYNRLIDPSRMRYMETYNASEGFFALQAEPADDDMMLLCNCDTFYEFIPLSELDNESPRAIPAWETQLGETYALVITSSNGLWRYIIGDTVKITSTSPLKIKITGRTTAYINAFGEELMVCDAEAALARACAACHCAVSDYSAAPVFATTNSKGRHQWAISFSTPPSDIETFALTLDRELCNENSDYQAKRSGDIFLDRPIITPVSPDAFDKFLLATGKLGGQRKIPRLRNDRSVIDAILKYNTLHNPQKNQL